MVTHGEARRVRLHSLPAADFWMARNSLTQRPPGPECVATVELDASGLEAGDTAGLALLNSPYAWVGLVKTADGMNSLQTLRPRRQPPDGAAQQPAFSPPPNLWLRVACNFDTEQAIFSWSADGKSFTPLGEPIHDGVSAHHVPGRSSCPIQLQLGRQARRLCRFRQLHCGRAASSRHRTRNSRGQDHHSDQWRRRKFPGGR